MNSIKKHWFKIILIFLTLLLIATIILIKLNYVDNTANNNLLNNANNQINNNTTNNSISMNNTDDVNLDNNLNITKQMVKLETNKGDITVELFSNDAPKTVENFLTLVNKGYYDGVIFHRVITGFMIQGGDPTGTGRGGPGYQFADELNASTESYKRGYVRGTLAMANAGPNTNGSQFFIMHQDNNLPHDYTIFGRVVTGLETVDAIATTPVDPSDRPLSEIVIKKAEVIE